MRKSAIGLVSMFVPALAGSIVMTGCGEDGLPGGDALDPAKVCGPCGTVLKGDVGISGNAKLDGFFTAVADLNKAQVAINGSFAANIDSLLATFGVDGMANASITAKVNALKAAIQAEISANASGGLVVNYAPPKCQANVNVAFEAQAKCEAKADCEVMATPPSIKVECQGKCTGECSGTCTGGFKCDVSAGATCTGKCSGSCELEAAASCNGTCRGSCSGSCSAYDGQGNCAGACDGDCTGNCELAAAAECQGTCTGSCEVTAEADCPGGSVECSGSCSAECSGGCEGSATPPSASANCSASADCKAQAKAQASANVECTPPSLEIGFEFAAGVNAAAQAQFIAKIGELKAKGIAILQGFAKYKALIDGEVDGEVVFNPAPLAVVTGELNAVVSAGVEGDLFADIPAGRILCVIPAMTEAVELLGTIGTQATANLTAQASFAGSLTSGFSG